MSTRSRNSKTSTFTKSSKPAETVTPAEAKESVSAEETLSEETAKTVDPKEPVSLEIDASNEPEKPAEAAAPEKIQTDVREKLANKSVEENVFIPANPVALEKAATQVAQEQGFELNRGTSIGARLMARAQKRF